MEMKSIFDNLCARKTGQRRPITGVVGDMAINETGNSSAMGFGTNDEYEMTLEITTIFWAGSTSKESAFEAAKKSLLHNLYADLLSKVSEARSAAIGQDYEALLPLLNDIEHTVLGER